MEFKGTKGKWKLYKHAFACVASDESSLLVSNCGGRTSNVNADELYIEQQANALHISKAPEMLEMISELLKELEFHGYRHSTTIYKAQNLIKEATTI